jgi:hypothetical protein
LESLKVVGSDGPRYMIEDHVGEVAFASLSCPSLKVRLRAVVGKLNSAYFSLSRIEHRKITDGVAQGHLVGVFGPSEVLAVANSGNHQSLSVLRNSVDPSVYDSGICFISDPFEACEHVTKNSHVVAQGHVGDVFHQNSSWLHPLYNVEEGSPKLTSMIFGVAKSKINEATNLGPASSGVRLTRRSTCYQRDVDTIENLDDVVSDNLVSQIELKGNALKIMGVGFQSPFIQIDRKCDSITSQFETIT